MLVKGAIGGDSCQGSECVLACLRICLSVCMKVSTFVRMYVCIQTGSCLITHRYSLPIGVGQSVGSSGLCRHLNQKLVSWIQAIHILPIMLRMHFLLSILLRCMHAFRGWD